MRWRLGSCCGWAGMLRRTRRNWGAFAQTRPDHFFTAEECPASRKTRERKWSRRTARCAATKRGRVGEVVLDGVGASACAGSASPYAGDRANRFWYGGDAARERAWVAVDEREK